MNQTPKQPTEAEINEAAVNTCPDTLANWSQETMFEVGFADGVKWLQNYQAEQPVKQGRSAEEILMPYVQRPDEAPDYVFLFHALQAMREHASQFQTPDIGGSDHPKYRVGRKTGTVILSYDGEKEIARVYDIELALQVCNFLNRQSSQPQPNAISETSDIGKIASDFVKQYPEMDSWDSFLSGATSQLNIDISVIEEEIKVMQSANEDRPGHTAEMCNDWAIFKLKSILTKLKKQP